MALRPLIFKGGNFDAKLGRVARRERGSVSLHRVVAILRDAAQERASSG
jgi:hypothetical protein